MRALHREESGERPPCDGEVDVSVVDGLDQARGRIVVAVVAVERETHDIVDDASPRERVRRRNIAAVVTDEMEPDSLCAKRGIVEALDARPTILARDEHV